MTSQRATALAIGILFIVATGFYVLGQTVYAPIVGSAEYLDLVYPQRARVIAGVFIEVVGLIAIPLIALLFYPVLRRHNEPLALTYVGVRLLEAIPLLAVAIHAWATVGMSRAYLSMGGAEAAAYQTTGNALQTVGESAFLMSVAFLFPLGALVLNWVLWRSGLVPKVISAWGLGAAALLLVGSLFSFFEALPPTSPVVLEIVLSGPIAVQEMVLAGWLVVKGFESTGVDSGQPIGTPRSA